MSTSAPQARLVDALSGNIAASPAQFFKALSDADALCVELDDVHELRTRVEELEASERLARADADDAAETIALLLAERDDLADRLVSLKAAADHTLGLLSDAKRELRTARRETERLSTERDTWRAAVAK